MLTFPEVIPEFTAFNWVVVKAFCLLFQVEALAILSSANVPLVIFDAGRLGISVVARSSPFVTRPLES